MKNSQPLHIVGKEVHMYNKIKAFCEQQNITIHQLCLNLGINDSVISNLKNRPGQKSLSAENTAKIADFMGMSVTELLKKGDE